LLSKLKLIYQRPRRYVPLLFRYILRLPQRALSVLSAHTGMFLQEQMDIHPYSTWHDPDFVKSTGGFFLPGDTVARRITNLEPWDLVRRDMLVLLLRDLLVRKVPGDIIELGVYRGQTARLIHNYMPDRRLYLFDTFEGFSGIDLAGERRETGLDEIPGHYADTSIDDVLKRIGGDPDRIIVHKGIFPHSFPSELDGERFSFIHVDMDLYEPTLAALEILYDRMSPGGYMVIHDYNSWPGPRRAVDEFFQDKPENPIPMPDKNGSVVVRKGE
jgi:O-methyltransferase